MNSRIKLRRTQAALNSVNETLLEGEALYSFNDKALVIGNGSTQAKSLPNRFIAVAKQSVNKVWAGPASGSSTAFPTFRALVVNDLPNNIPLSKISGTSGVWVPLDNVKSKGSATQPVYFNANGVAVACTYTLSKAVPADAIFKYIAGAGISISGSTITNTGVRSIATGSSNGTINVNTNGTTTSIPVKGLGTAAYKNVSDFAVAGTYAAAESSSSSAAASAVKLKTAR